MSIDVISWHGVDFYTAAQYIEKLRRRSKTASNNKKIFSDAFGNEPVKLLGIPTMIDDYNTHKSEVDRFDQCKSYYSVQQAKRRTWRPLLYFLLDLALNNAYRLSSYSSRPSAKRTGHKDFLYALIEQLFERGGRLCNGSNKRQHVDDIVSDAGSSHTSTRLFAEAKTLSCATSGRKKHNSRPPRQPLTTTSGNRKAPLRTPRSTFGCRACRLPLCRPEERPECWQEHLQRCQTITSKDTSQSSIIK